MMSGFLKLLAENIFVVIGFAIYGLLVYYMVAKAIRRYTGTKSGRSSKKKPGKNKSISDQDNSESSVFFTMFNKDREEPEEETPHRKDFSRDLPTANSHRHKKSQEE